MSTIRANTITDSSGGSNAVLNGVVNAPSSMGFRNRIIGGCMRIDQRNNGASVTQSNAVVYTLDRWYSFGTVASKFTIQQSTDAPTGFRSSAKITSSSAYAVGAAEQFIFTQGVEGFNVSDLGFGAAGASSVTLSFWVKSSLTGTFAGGVSNAATDRSYPFSYTISAANTWEQKTVTITGDTTGTWNTTNGVGLYLNFTMGAGSSFQGTVNTWNAANVKSVAGATSVVGTSGATWFVTGVQLEAGSVATNFERRDYGRELMMCQRYYSTVGSFAGGGTTATQAVVNASWVTPMRASPSISGTAALKITDGYTADYTQSSLSVVVQSGSRITTQAAQFVISNFSGLTAGRPYSSIPNEGGVITLSAEL